MGCILVQPFDEPPPPRFIQDVLLPRLEKEATKGDWVEQVETLDTLRRLAKYHMVLLTSGEHQKRTADRAVQSPRAPRPEQSASQVRWCIYPGAGRPYFAPSGTLSAIRQRDDRSDCSTKRVAQGDEEGPPRLETAESPYTEPVRSSAFPCFFTCRSSPPSRGGCAWLAWEPQVGGG